MIKNDKKSNHPFKILSFWFISALGAILGYFYSNYLMITKIGPRSGYEIVLKIPFFKLPLLEPCKDSNLDGGCFRAYANSNSIYISLLGSILGFILAWLIYTSLKHFKKK